MKDITKEFLRSWLQWVESGAPDGEPYYHHHGLCASARVFISEGGLPSTQPIWDFYSAWKEEGLDTIYPFGKDDYDLDCVNNRMHLSEARLKWVRKHVA